MGVDPRIHFILGILTIQVVTWKKRDEVLHARHPKTKLYLNIACFLFLLYVVMPLLLSLSCVCVLCERDEKDRLCTTGFASVICDANASSYVCHMLVQAMQTSGGSVWVGQRFWLYLPGATRVYLTVCSSYGCSHKSAKTLTIRPDYCPSPVTCCRWPVIFLFFRLITKTAKQAKCVGCLSASLALLDC